MSTRELEKYFSIKIEGWATPVQAVLMSFFLERIRAHGLTGDFMEIGVYQGQFGNPPGLVP